MPANVRKFSVRSVIRRTCCGKSACEQADVVDLSCALQIDFPPTSQISRNKAIKQSDASRILWALSEMKYVVKWDSSSTSADRGNLPLLGMAVAKRVLLQKSQ